MHVNPYPFHESLSQTLPMAESPLFVMRLIRRLIHSFSITDIEAELLVGLASRTTRATFEDVCDILPHFDDDRVKRIIKRMVQTGFVDADSCDDDHGFSYLIKPVIASQIASIDKSSLQ